LGGKERSSRHLGDGEEKDWEGEVAVAFGLFGPAGPARTLYGPARVFNCCGRSLSSSRSPSTVPGQKKEAIFPTAPISPDSSPPAAFSALEGEGSGDFGAGVW
jgi:hypothetical protein